MRQHIKKLCQQHNIKIEKTKVGFQHSIQDSCIIGQELSSFKRYIRILHEIGHIVTYNKHDNILEREGNAWLWVRREFKKEHGVEDKRLLITIKATLKKYLHLYLGNKGIKTPNDSHPFWVLMRIKL